MSNAKSPGQPASSETPVKYINLTPESFVEWAQGWVPDEPRGQRARFASAMREELARLLEAHDAR